MYLYEFEPPYHAYHEGVRVDVRLQIVHPGLLYVSQITSPQRRASYGEVER